MDISSKKRGIGTSFVAFGAAVLIATGALCALPARAQAADACVAHSFDGEGNRTDYKNWSDAVKDGQQTGKTIVMDADWVVSGSGSSGDENKGSVTVERGKKLTIDMNGHKVDNDSSYFDNLRNTPTFSVRENAELTLTSSKTIEISYSGYDDDSAERVACKVTTGGLVTNTSNDRCGILVCKSATLNLKNVSVAGCRGDYEVEKGSDEARDGYSKGYYTMGHLNGGVTLDSNSVINMTKGASIEHNLTRTRGGGLYIAGSNVTVNMDNAAIHDNHASKVSGGVAKGGGIYSEEIGTVITMENESKIYGNSAYGGGGIYFSKSQFSLTSEDGKAYIEGNAATCSSTAERAESKNGGGIHVDKASGTNKGLIKNIAISKNRSECDGGGIELDQKATVVRNCTITENTCKYEGGGICDTNDNNKIDSSTISGNACNTSGDNYGGGGVFVGCMSDIKLAGTCTITGNTRDTNSGNADDLFLNENAGASAKAYIIGSLAEGSSVGVRTGIAEADRRIAKNFSYPDSKDCLFMDLDGYFVTYGTDEGGDAWQRYGTKEFELKVNGATAGRYKSGATATANGTSADATKVFKRWSAEGSTGLHPFSSYIEDGGLANPAVSFKMPQNDVDLKAEYVARTKDVEVALAAPRDGVLLSSEGSVAWTSPDGASGAETVAVAWYKKGDNGTLELATGKAEADAVYVARVSLAQDVQKDRAFALDIEASDVTVNWTGAGDPSKGTASTASVDASGTLSITSGEYTAGGATFTGVEDISLTFAAGTPKADFEAALPAKATAIKSSGGTKQFDIDWSGADFSAWFADGAIKSGLRGITLYRPLKNTGGALPDSVTVAVSFAFTAAETEMVDVPEVKPAAGTYGVSGDSAKFDADGTKMTLTASAAGGTSVKYTLSRSDGSDWKVVAEAADYGSGIDLDVVKGATAAYRVEIWAVKGDLESRHAALYYTIEDDRPAEKATVTVKYSDTADDEHHGSRADDAYKVQKGQGVTLAAPDREGYAFEKWTVDGKDRTGSALTLENVDDDVTVTAVYNPVVTEIDVKMDAPQAHRALMQGAESVTVKAAGSAVDITKYLSNSHGSGNPAITWEPGAADDEGNAGHATAYTASLAFESGGSQASVKYVLAADVAVKCDGESIDKSAAYIAEGDDGAERVYISFPVTGAYEEPAVSKLGDVDLTFAEAWSKWTGSREPDGDDEQGAGDLALAWSLPDQVQVDYKCDESELYDIAWTSIDDFDASATGKQALTATGTITWPDYVDIDDGKGALVSNEVTVKINIAAPETVGTPTASVKAGAHKGAQWVELSCRTEGAAIRYTTDGSEPDESSAEYTGAIEVAHSAAIKAKAFCDAMLPSKTAEFGYTIKHKVTFDAGTAGNLKTEWVADGTAVSRPADPKIDGLGFEGWRTKDGVDYNFDDAVTGDTVLYASWSSSGEAVHPHTVAFDSAGGTAVTEQHVVDGGRATKPEDPELDDLKFEGWFTEDGREYDFGSKVDGSFTLYAHWSVNGDAQPAHVVIFDSAPGSAVDAQTVADGGRAYEPQAPTYDGFTFVGWFTEGGDEAYDFSTEVTEDLVLYAHWSKNGDDASAHVVTFDSAGGSAVAEKIVGAGKCVQEPAAPTRSGYDFTGWTLSGELYDFSTPVTGDLTLVATWKKQESKKDDADKGDGKKDDTRKDDTRKDDDKSDTDEGEDDSGTGDKRKGDGAKTVTKVTAEAKSSSALAATGDRTPLIVGTLVVLGILAAAAGILANRKKK